MQNNICPNVSDRINFVMCEQTLEIYKLRQQRLVCVFHLSVISILSTGLNRSAKEPLERSVLESYQHPTDIQTHRLSRSLEIPKQAKRVQSAQDEPSYQSGEKSVLLQYLVTRLLKSEHDLGFIDSERKRTLKRFVFFFTFSPLNVNIKLDSLLTHLDVMSLFRQ